MTRKKSLLKRKRDGLITNAFFALRPDDEEADSDSTVKCSNPRLGEPKPGDWIRTDLINKVNTPKYQEHVGGAHVAQASSQERKDELPAPVCFEWRNQTKDCMAATSEVVRDESCPITTRIDAECGHTLARAAHMGEELGAVLYLVQAFNADKPVHVASEQDLKTRKQQAARHGSVALDGPSFLAKIEAESAKLDTSAQSVKTSRKGKCKVPARMKGTIDVVLAEFEQGWRTAVEIIREVHEGITGEPAQLSTPPPEDLTFYSHKLPPSLPQYIRQELHDVEFVLREISFVKNDITRLRDKARNICMVWLGGDSVTWEYGMAHAHESPHMVLYEHVRLGLAACYILWRRAQDKVYRYVRQNDDLNGIFSKGLGNSLRVTASDEQLRAREWPRMMEFMKDEAGSVAEMLEECKEARRTLRKKKGSKPGKQQELRLKALVRAHLLRAEVTGVQA